jgi:CRISPR-associated protein (TIGR03984 family)
MNRLEGCKIEYLDNSDCRRILGKVTDGEQFEGSLKDGIRTSDYSWLLAHCYDGVVWGYFDKDLKKWRLSFAVFSDLCPPVSGDNLLEMRLFGSKDEIMIWRKGAELFGRRLIDDYDENDDSPVRPHTENRILLGDRLIEQPRGGFSRVGTAAGAEQAVPWECEENDFRGGRWPLRLEMRHYFQQDTESGAVRVAATRLVDVKEV